MAVHTQSKHLLSQQQDWQGVLPRSKSDKMNTPDCPKVTAHTSLGQKESMARTLADYKIVV